MSTQPWLDALEAKTTLIEMYDQVIRQHGGRIPGTVGEQMPVDTMKREMHSLRLSESFSFSGFALDAIRQAAKTIPGDVALSSSHCPQGGAGWWWFSPPLDVATTWTKTPLVALHWNFYVSVSSRQLRDARIVKDEVASRLAGEPMVKLEFDEECPFHMDFSGYVRSDRDGLILPTIGWKWLGGETLDTMVEKCRAAYRPKPGRRILPEDDPERDTEITMRAITALSRFFLAAQTWIAQDIVEAAPQHVERHHGKRLAKRMTVTSRPTVRVIQLRKKRIKDESIRPTNGPLHHEVYERHYSCQWVVSGHWRNQPYGPGRTQRKLVYVNPYVKGPDEMPLREARPKVFAVMR